jgi:2-polyprenyl-3-methyl-5-hydroxy-6-metoxy-1,4-benzoquinol methylase
MMASVPDLDMGKAQTFAFKVVNDIIAQMLGPLSVVGDRLELFKALGTTGPVTSAEFAECAQINERYAREWLAAMACQGYVGFDNTTKRFTLPPEHALVLVDQDSPLYFASLTAQVPTYYANVDLLAAAFQHGGGVPQERFGSDWRCGLERFTRLFFHNNLVQQWIPAMPAVDAKLQAGGSVADVGCGNGQALLYLAKAYPAATFVGYDAYMPAVATARGYAEAAGLADRVRYEVCDVTQGIPDTFDLITTFDVVHDMPFPRPALKAIRNALKPGGSYFVQEINFSGDLQENIDHPLGVGAFGYAASVNYCMTQALAVGGEGTGTCMGVEKVREMAAEAGFGHFQQIEIPHNPFGLFYEMQA